MAIAVTVYAPRSGEPALLVPLDAEAAGAIPALLSHPEVQILARGQVSGSYVIVGNLPDFATALTAHRVLVLNADAPGCGAAVAGQIA
ncbi:hypothetical protein [Qipengyuania sp. ASV99]|uniref:hypothetical protein n=1 Tax=Qipengyuania sp. ASV99 TaxID=3399681 RepID=UPI003A4C5473